VTRDPRIDDYIAKAEPFARPILEHLRGLIHAACPDAIETIKWSRPNFEHKGRVFASLGAFKAHASLTLWRVGEMIGGEKEGMGQFGKLASLADLPDDGEVMRVIRAATTVIDRGPAPKVKAPRAPLPVPDELAAALAEAPAARATFEGFSPSHRRDYCEWIGEAKRPETRAARVAQAIAWMAEGKPRHWKYQR
jgi:uncharacterized protein YdeI (YjbR/CyaY-like superfamily)